MDRCEFKDDLIYRVSAMTKMNRETLSQKTKKKKK